MKIQIDKQVIEQALEVMAKADLHVFDNTITALRSALESAESVEPVGEIIGQGGGFVGDVLYGVKWLNSGSLPIGAKLYLEPQLFDNSEQVDHLTPNQVIAHYKAKWGVSKDCAEDIFEAGERYKRLTHPAPAVPKEVIK